jgi:hypothetical protein
MAEDRGRPSSSDDLLREARQRVLDGELYSDDYVRPPDDDRYGGNGDDDAPPVSELDGDGDLSAVDIAELLAEEREKSNPQPEPADEPAVEPAQEDPHADPRAGMTALPDWALDDDAPTRPQPHHSVETVGAVAASTPLAERIRLLSMQQEQPTAPPDGEAPMLQTPPPPSGDRDIWSTPAEEWESRAKTKPTSSSSTSWIKPVISLIVFAVLSIGFFTSVLDGRESIEDVAVGDCFDSGDAAEIHTVPIIDCSELHSSELYAKVNIEAFEGDYPSDDSLYTWVNARCEEQFPAYVGEPYEDSRYWIEVFLPTEGGWDEGDRTGLCTVVLVDQNLEVRPALGSARDWGEQT